MKTSLEHKSSKDQEILQQQRKVVARSMLIVHGIFLNFSIRRNMRTLSNNSKRYDCV